MKPATDNQKLLKFEYFQIQRNYFHYSSLVFPRVQLSSRFTDIQYVVIFKNFCFISDIRMYRESLRSIKVNIVKDDLKDFPTFSLFFSKSKKIAKDSFS